MYIGIKTLNTKDYKKISNFVINKLNGKRKHINKIDDYCYFEVISIADSQIKELNTYKEIADIIFKKEIWLISFE